LCKEETAAVPRQSKHRLLHRTTASAGHWASEGGKILQTRKAYGTFKSVNDLQAIRGIGPKKLEKMRKYLIVGKPPQNKKASTEATQGTKTPAAKDSPGKPEPPPKQYHQQQAKTKNSRILAQSPRTVAGSAVFTGFPVTAPAESLRPKGSNYKSWWVGFGVVKSRGT
jgi:hypothetical protein